MAERPRVATNDPALPEPPKSRNWLLRCYEHSPWLTISVLLHVMIITLLAISRPVRVLDLETGRIDVGPAQRDVLPPVEPPPEEPLVREVPVLPDEQEGPVNPDPNYTPQAPPGRVEVTDQEDPKLDPGIFNPDPNAAPELPSGPTGGTPIGPGIYGHFGKPSPWVGRKPGGGGPGSGGPGNDGGGPGGSPQTQEAVDAALRWLRDHQSPDGHWDCEGFSAQCKRGTCDGPGSSAHDVGVTGLALLCFLGGGHTHRDGQFTQTVRSGIRYLRDQQDSDGCFGPRIGQHFLYDHACAALAMAEAFGMTQERQLQKPAQQGINFILRAQNPYAAWRYAFPPDGDNDTSVTGWMVMALKSASMAGLTIDEASYASAMNWITEMTDPLTGRTGYTDRGSAPSRLNEMMQLFPAERSEALTAVGMLVRMFAQADSGKDELITKGGDLLAAKPPVWDPAGGIDFYYWYYGTLSMFQLGGPRWNKWNAALKTACIAHQRLDERECSYGSWDAVDPWSVAGGRVYATAMNCLSMEVYYRYPRVFGMATVKPKPPPKPK